MYGTRGSGNAVFAAKARANARGLGYLPQSGGCPQAAVEDGGVPRGALPPPVLFQNGLPAGRGGAPGQETQLFRDGSWKVGSPFWRSSDHLLMCV
jgi:hypothetical protein